MPDAPAVDIEQGLTQRPHATACQTCAPLASPTWPAHSLCLPSEQGKSRCATRPSNRPCYNQIQSHKPKSPKSNANPPSTSKNPAPKSPSIRQQMRQHTPLESPRCRQKQGELASNASTSRAPSMEDDTETESVRRRRRAEMVRGGAARSPRQSPGGTPFPFPGHAIREYEQCQKNMVRWALKGL